MSSILVALRQETKEIHADLHGNPVLKRCQENKLDIDDYIQMLLAFYQPWKELIHSVEQVPISNLQPLLLQRHQLLYNDLIALNVDKIMLASEKTAVLSQDEVLGMCYVVIGSSMGAIQLSQNIKMSLGNQPRSYLSMSPKEAGWPLLSSFLKSTDAKDFPKASITARKVFKSIYEHLSSVSSLR